MTKNECLERAKRARHQQKLSAARAALYVATFGGNSDLAQQALLDADVAGEAAQKWEWFARVHPKTRGCMLRNMQLPKFMFGF